jgi:hypothetical protein
MEGGSLAMQIIPIIVFSLGVSLLVDTTMDAGTLE